MCLSVPAQIIEFVKNPLRSQARVECGGNTLIADVSLVDDLSIGDYVLLHAGIAIGKYEIENAEKTIELHKELSGILAEERKNTE